MGSHQFERYRAEYNREPWDIEKRLLAELIHLFHIKDFKAPHPSVTSILGMREHVQTQDEMLSVLNAFSAMNPV